MLKENPETREVPIVVISVSDNKELGFRLGVYDYLMKPADSDALLGVLKRLESDGVRDILVVDDDPTTVSLISQMLEEGGFASRSASNGAEALSEIERGRPDAIFLDLMMPVMDGFEVIDRLQADPELRKISVVVVTAKDLTGEEQKFLQERVSGVVEKGRLDPDRLMEELRETLDGYSGGGV